MYKICLAGLALLALSACATGYTPPKERAPDNWYLPTGFVPDISSLEITQGPVALGGELYRMNALPITAGQLKNDVRWGKEGEFMLPAGTRVYANQFTLVMTSNYSSTVNMNKNNDPIEWCAMGPKDRPVCMFFHSPTEALYITGRGIPAKARMTVTTGDLGDLFLHGIFIRSHDYERE